MTKIFCDIADKKLIKLFNKKKLLKGLQQTQALWEKQAPVAINYIV